MRTFYFTVKHAHWRNGTTVAITAGFVIAIDEEEAKKIIYEKMGEDIFDLSLKEIMKHFLLIIYPQQFLNKESRN